MIFEDFNDINLNNFYSTLESINNNSSCLNKLWEDCKNDQTDGQFFLYNYYCYKNNILDKRHIMDHHWDIFTKGWASSPLFLSVYTDCSLPVSLRLKSFEYLYAYIVPYRFRKKIFSKVENFFLGYKFEPPEKVVLEIKDKIKKHRKEDDKLKERVNKKMIKLIKEEINLKRYLRSFINKPDVDIDYSDPADYFEGYQLPESF